MSFYSKGQESQVKGDYQTAIKYFTQCLKQNQNDINCLKGIGNAYKETQDYQTANQFYEQCLKVDQKEITCLFMTEYNQAIKFANQCVKYHPNESVCYETKGSIQLQMEKYEESAESFNKCLQLKNDNFNCAINLAVSSYECDKIDVSEKASQQCLKLGATKKGGWFTTDTDDSYQLSTLCNYLLGEIYNKKNDTKKAQQYFQDCLKINPDFEGCERKLTRNFFYDKGLQSQTEEKQQEAVQYFQECLKEDKNHIKCLKALGNIYDKQKNYEKANYYFEQCLKIKPKELSCLTNLSETLRSDKQYEKSMEYTDKCIKYHPQSPICYIRKGEIFSEQQKYFLAEEQFSKSYKLDSNNVEHAYYLAGALFHTDSGKKYEAEKIAQECVKIGRNSTHELKIPLTSQCYFLLGAIYLQRNQHEKSQQYFKECLQVYPYNEECRRNKSFF